MTRRSGPLRRIVAVALLLATVSVGSAAESSSLWVIDYAKSQIEFAGDQAGAPFTGRFHDWQAAIELDLSAPQEARFAVDIDLASAASGDSDRDATLQEDAWFATAIHPVATFSATEFALGDAGDWVSRDATLTIKGQTHPVTFSFAASLEPGTTVVTLRGTATLSRLALGIGTGDWADTEWVGDAVVVTVVVQGSLNR
ncbi:MAG: YceI family protein [Pseudomonadota bacterium]